MRRHLVFIGLPGSGKSSVGRLVAERLSAEFVDIDAAIERRQGMPVDRIFAELGEKVFRKVEHETMAAILEGDPVIISPGGGWAAQPGEVDAAKERGFVIYLKTMVTTAVERTQMHDYRPLLLTDDPYARMRELLQEREPFYEKAHDVVTNGPGPIVEVVDEVVALARRSAGW